MVMLAYVKRQGMKVGVIGLGLGGFVAYDAYDKSAHYVQVTGDVREVTELCHLEWHKRKANRKTEEMPCADAMALKQSDPETFNKYDLEYDTKVKVAFKSPADNNWHVDVIEQHKHDNGAAIHVGDKLPVLAHKTEADHLRRL
jgi:hypothetical protein